jgi:cytoskeletal protein CcmA (bactofilin family)
MLRRKTPNSRAAARAIVTSTTKKNAAVVGGDSHGGALDAGGNLRVDTVTGPITHDHDVIVGSKGMVFGKIRAKSIVVDGTVNGDLYATESILVNTTATIHGDLHAPRIGVLTGAQLRGRIVMRHRPDHAKELDDAAVHRLLAGIRS